MQIPQFNDPLWDTVNNDQRESWIVELTRLQLAYMKREIPFYSTFYASISANDICSLKDCITKIPALTKSQVRQLNSPFDLLSKKYIEQQPKKLLLHRGTGGTTGQPTSVFFTHGDFRACIEGCSRYYLNLKDELSPIIAFDNYNQGHISAPYFEALFRELFNCCIITRNFQSSDEDALHQLVQHRCNAIITPAIATHKGGSLEDLLDADVRTGTNYINGDNIKIILCSSTEVTDELYQEITDLGIKYVINAYGSTDVGGVAWSYATDPRILNLNFGHITAFVVDDDQRHVKDGERGYLIASKIGSYQEDGSIGPFEGTPLLNFHLGDEVTYHANSPLSGVTASAISNPERVIDIEEKIESGCQVW